MSESLSSNEDTNKQGTVPTYHNGDWCQGATQTHSYATLLWSQSVHKEPAYKLAAVHILLKAYSDSKIRTST